MGIKNAGKAKIKKNLGKAPTKETVDTPMSECEAENPLECRFHGLKALEQQLSALLPAMGYKVPFGTDKLQGGKGFEIRIDGKFDVNQGEFLQGLTNAFKQQGWNLTYNGKIEDAGHQFFLKKGSGKAKAQKKEDAEKKDDVDLVNEDMGDFDDLLVAEEMGKDDLDLMDFVGEPEKLKGSKSNPFEGIDITEEDIEKAKKEQEINLNDIEDFLNKGGMTADNHYGDTPWWDILANWEGFVKEGKSPNGAKLVENLDMVKEYMAAAGDDNKVTKALKAKIEELTGEKSEKTDGKQPSFEDAKDFLKKGNILEGDISDLVENIWGPIVFTGHYFHGDKVGEPWLEKFEAAVKELPDHPVTKVVKGWLGHEDSNDKLPEPPKEIPVDAEENIGDFDDLLIDDEVSGESGSEETKITKEQVLDFLNSNDPKDEEWAVSINDGTIKPLFPTLGGYFQKFMGQKGKDHPVTKALMALGLNFPGESASGGGTEKILSDEDIKKAWMKSMSEVNLALNTGSSPWKKKNKDAVSALYNEYLEAANAKDVKKMGEALKKLQAIESTIPKKSEAPQEEEKVEAIDKPSKIEGVDESLMKPLEHDESKFPPSLAQKELEAAIAKGKKAGGHGGLHTTIVEIGGKKYICKNGAGKKSNIIKNGFNADMAYRAGGVYVPDAKLYEFGDGKTYKLSEFIEGKKLIDVWKGATEAKREKIRKELLKGFPLDALFSNYDVLGTSPEESQTVTITGADGKPQKTHVAFDNIMIGNDGHAYRIDNDGAFAMTGTGGHKSSSGGSYTVPVEAEQWDNWDERQWIDDFRTMRRNEKNLGIFDRYSTADIFMAAGNINLNKAVESLPAPLQKALAKPLFEMKQMTYRAVNISLGGFRNNGFVSMALDASYEASKKGLREQCQLAVAWNNPGFGKFKQHWGNYQPQPFGEKEPEPPQDPTTVLNSKLKNEEYTGGKIGEIILNAAKTINHHGGVKQTDKDGKVLGNGTAMSTPDYDPNAAKIAEWEKIDREKLEELAKTDENAKTLLGLYDTIAYSKENGWKKPIGQIPTGLVIKGKLNADFKSSTEKKILDDMAGALEEFKAKEKKYRKDLQEYEKRKSAHKKKEEEKALAAGGSPYHNFHHFAQALMEEGINTDGIAHRVKTNGMDPIESSMHSQKGTSYGSDAVKWKVREMMALGYTPEQILKMAEDGDLYNGSYYTTCINNSLMPHKEEWDKDMNSQAMYMGLNMLKMENEHSDLYDKESGVVFLNRNIGNIPKGLAESEKAIYASSTATGWVGPHIDSAADCMQFEANSWSASKKQVYAVPLSRIVCCANNESYTGGGYGYHDEQEYVGNLYQLPCWVYHSSNKLTWKNAIDKAKKSDGMKNLLKKFAMRLAAFNTLIK